MFTVNARVVSRGLGLGGDQGIDVSELLLSSREIFVVFLFGLLYCVFCNFILFFCCCFCRRS